MINDDLHPGQSPEPPKPHSDILGAVSSAQQTEILRTIDAHAAVSEYLAQLSQRERMVLEGRFGLTGQRILTLEEIGSKLSLTRERVRQIEKDSVTKLCSLVAPQAFQNVSDVMFQFIEDRGNIARQDLICNSIAPIDAGSAVKNSLLFVLHSGTQFIHIKESDTLYESWMLTGLDLGLVAQIGDTAIHILREAAKPINSIDLIAAIRQKNPESELAVLPGDAIESYLNVSKKIGRNPFDEFGLSTSPEIKPKDVGDKAYLVLLHLAHPEHYGKITELINKRGFDDRVAHRESVHNELIRDKRFVLVGRGMYGLKEWGYQPGVVADIIAAVITEAGHALSRDQIVSEVMKQRVVKRNTIIVGLSNKRRFQKTADNKYTNAPNI